MLFFLQIAELCTVETNISSNSSNAGSLSLNGGDDKIDNTESDSLHRSFSSSSNHVSSSTTNNQSNELICLDESTSSQMDFGGITLDNFELAGFNDDDFDPRAEESFSSMPSTPAPTLTTTSTPTPAPPPPASVVQLAPPPALPPREQMMKKASPIPENNNNPFNNPFSSSSSDPFGMASFAANTPAITPSKPDPFAALDDLDPFKNIQ